MKTDRIRLPAAFDRRTKRLLHHLRPGWAAVVDHRGIDRTSALALIERRAGAVVNFQPSAPPEGPAFGAALLLAAGIPLFDVLPGEDRTAAYRTVLAAEAGRRRLTFFFHPRQSVQNASLGSAPVRLRAVGAADVVRAVCRDAEAFPGRFLAFVQNTAERMRKEAALFLTPLEVPELRAASGRVAVVVARSPGAPEALRRLLPVVAAFAGKAPPYWAAVDGGADHLLRLDLPIDLLVGDMDSVGASALRVAALRIVHAYPDGRAPGERRLRALGLSYRVVPSPGTSEDLAVRLVADGGARLILLFGNGADFLAARERGRAGVAGALLVRLLYGDRIVDLSAAGTGFVLSALADRSGRATEAADSPPASGRRGGAW
ncbi:MULTISPECIES: putative cytokinetic ring protein SteA [Hydrogenibacillus]|uniref:Conserved membrane protein n=1 Tax=Hydrogenibacillus schlegelii TaxID=1484 RepID=A0A2T5GC32_HYDSH|nr:MULTISPECIES: putative cytokinetic ring protein SteA [Hydrogenibacillus]PTQ53726.1 MAG: conserved membrane protein [Hydrogenibacillus schlegelii]QZA32025.1 hypothetical protein K2M58_06605 [Hydrogenibacillus sp. N12]